MPKLVAKEYMTDPQERRTSYPTSTREAITALAGSVASLVAAGALLTVLYNRAAEFVPPRTDTVAEGQAGITDAMTGAFVTAVATEVIDFVTPTDS